MSAVLAPHLRLRRMQEADLPAVIAIETVAYDFPWSQQIFSDCLRVGYHAQVLELDTHLIGYGLISIVAGEGHLLNLCIHPNYRGCGYGYFILKHLLAFARRCHVDSIFLEVRPSNEAAMQLYTKMGFNQIGIRKGYYPTTYNRREDALLLALAL